MCFTETIIQAAGFRTLLRRMARITQLTSSLILGHPTTPSSYHTRKGAFLRLSVLRSSHFAHEILTCRLLIDYRWFDAVSWGPYHAHAVAVTDFSWIETNHPAIRVWFRAELYHLQVLEPKYRKAHLLTTIPGRGRLGVWQNPLHECHRRLEGHMAPSSRIPHHF